MGEWFENDNKRDLAFLIMSLHFDGMSRSSDKIIISEDMVKVKYFKRQVYIYIYIYIYLPQIMSVQQSIAALFSCC